MKDLTLREIGVKLGHPGSPQKMKHHLDQLAKKGFLRIDREHNLIELIMKNGAHGSIISLPIMGKANCGEAASFADNHVEEYLQVTKGVLGDLAIRAKDLFVLQAVGSSMNQAHIGGDAIEDGDYVIVDRQKVVPEKDSYVVSLINGVANIKKIYIDEKNQRIILASESNQDIPPIYIHKDDLDDYMISGTVVKVMKRLDELADFRDAAAMDTLRVLGTISKGEADYYNNPANFKKYSS